MALIVTRKSGSGESSISIIDNTVIIGDGTVSTAENGIVAGNDANIDHDLAIVLGRHGQSQRTAEISNNINANANNNFMRGEVGFVGITTSAIPTEIFAGGLIDERFNIQPESVVTFEAYVTGRDNVSGNVCSFRISGTVKRDNLNNTVAANAFEEMVLAQEDLNFNVDVSVDDLNNALIITVTAATTNTTQWVANVSFIETIF